MFEYINGLISDVGNDYAVIDINGVGFRATCSTNTLRSLKTGKIFKLFTTLVVKEDSMTLYGFSDTNEMSIFKLLNTVSGIGPKAALSLLSSLKTDELVLAIVMKNNKELTKAPGIGKKTADRIILELRDKLNSSDHISSVAADDENNNTLQAVQALTSLGYGYNEATFALSKIEDKNIPIDSLIKEALKQLSRI